MNISLMNTKLTLTVEENLIRKAKAYAKKNGRSLSDLVENYLKLLTHHDDPLKGSATPITNSLIGSFKPPAGFDFDYKKALTKALTDKYLSDDKNTD